MAIEFPDFDIGSQDTKIYYILLRPGQPVFSWVKDLQYDSDRILHRHIMQRSSVPHITLLQFFMSEKYEQHLADLTREFSGSLDCSGMFTGGLAEFPNIQTIYLDIMNQEPVKRQLTEFVRELFKRRLIRNQKSLIHQADKLHITIVKRVASDKYNYIRQHLFSRIFHDHAVNPECVVLLKGPGSVHKWDKVSEFPLSNNKSIRSFF